MADYGRPTPAQRKNWLLEVIEQYVAEVTPDCTTAIKRDLNGNGTVSVMFHTTENDNTPELYRVEVSRA